MTPHNQVIHLSTSHSGGAGIAARRLNQGLNATGFDSFFYSIKRDGYFNESNEDCFSRSPSVRLFSAINAKANSYIGTNESFFSLTSMSIFDRNLLKSFKETPILHVHNWFNFFNSSDLEILLHQGNQLIFTLHDTRLLTGGCHSTLNCNEFTRGCGGCPNVKGFANKRPAANVKRLREIFIEYKGRIEFIAPSRYLQEIAADSHMLADLNVSYIPNHLADFGVGYNRKKRNLSSFVVGVASADPESLLKGGDIVSELMKSVHLTRRNIDLLLLNECETKFRDGGRYFWESIDVLLVPSRFDNSPNVIHEAKSIGIPVIATKVGGIVELLECGLDLGIDYADLNQKTVTELIIQLSESPLNSQKQNQVQGQEKAASIRSIEEHVKLYTRCLFNQ